MGRRVTLDDVAKVVGLSAAAVSMVLNNRTDSRIPSATARRVRQAASELGYVPHASARALRTRRTQSIGFISDEVTVTRFASAMIRGVLDECAQAQEMVLIAEVGDDPQAIGQALNVFRGRDVDGLLVGMMAARCVALPQELADSPLVVANGVVPGHDAVLPDEYRAGYRAARYVVERGHRRIALIGRSELHLRPEISATVPSRLAGLDDALAQDDLRFVAEYPGVEWNPEFGYQAGISILKDSSITAVIVINDQVAMGVYQAAQTLGLSVPEDVSVMSFDDEPLATYLRPQVSTMRLPYREIGEYAASLLLDAIRGRGRGSGADSLGEGPAPHPRAVPVAPDARDPRADESFRILLPMPLMERGSVALPNS